MVHLRTNLAQLLFSIKSAFYGLVILKFYFCFFAYFQEDETGVAELKQGGAIYLIGVVFFKLDGRLPLAHAIWHLHVVIASMIHYWAVVEYLIPGIEGRFQKNIFQQLFFVQQIFLLRLAISSLFCNKHLQELLYLQVHNQWPQQLICP